MQWKDPDELAEYVAAMRTEERKQRDKQREEAGEGVVETEGEESEEEGQQSYIDTFGTSVNLSEYIPPTNASAIPRQESRRADLRRDGVAKAMWTQYKSEMRRRELAGFEAWNVDDLFYQGVD